MAQLSDLVPLCNRLPSATVDQLIGATRAIARSREHMSQGKLAKALRFDDEQMVGVVEFLSRLGLVQAIGSDLALTEDGKRVAAADIPGRRRLFSDLSMRLPVIRAITEALAGKPNRSASRGELLEYLGSHACPDDADRVFEHVLSWGRYARLFSYDTATELVRLS